MLIRRSIDQTIYQALLSQVSGSPQYLVVKLENDPVAPVENVSYKSCNDSIVIIQLSIENKGVPPWGGVWRQLMSVVNGSVVEPVPSSVRLEQGVSQCRTNEQLVSGFLRNFTDVFGILPAYKHRVFQIQLQNWFREKSKPWGSSRRELDWLIKAEIQLAFANSRKMTVWDENGKRNENLLSKV